MPAFYYDGVPLHYRQYGNGEPVLLIHGLGCSGADWALQVSALEQQFCIIVPDLPGCGSSAPPRSGYSIAGFALTLWALINHLKVSCVNIVGFSMGGAVALEMVLQNPLRVPRLALINSLATYQDNWHKWVYARISAASIRFFGMHRAANIFATGLFPEPWQIKMRDRAAEIVASVPAAAYLGMSDALEEWSATDRLGRVRSRTLVIAGEHDHTPLLEKRALAAQLHASLVVVRGSRHGTPFDASKATNCCLLAWLTDQPSPPYDRLACDTVAGVETRALIRSRVEEHA